jgi:hypothetical protein
VCHRGRGARTQRRKETGEGSKRWEEGGGRPTEHTEHTEHSEGFVQEQTERTEDGGGQVAGVGRPLRGRRRVGREDAQKTQNRTADFVTELTERGHRGSRRRTEEGGGPAAPRAADRRGDALSRARSARPTPNPWAGKPMPRGTGFPARGFETQESESDGVSMATALGHRGGRRRAKNRNSGKRRRAERGSRRGARSDQRPAIAASYSALVRSV